MISLPELPNVYAVEVPKGASHFEIDGEYLYYKSDVLALAAIGHLKKLAPGNWQLIQPKVVSQYTGEDAKGVMLCINDWAYANYDENRKQYQYCDTAKASLQSLLTKYSLDENKIILIIKK